MADTIGETIIAAAEAALDGAGKPTGLTVHRNRQRPLDREDFPATVVYPMGEVPADDTHDPSTERTLHLRLEHRVAAVVSSTDSIDKTLDPLKAWGTKALLKDAPLKALVISLTELPLEWTGAEADRLYGGLAQDFELKYATVWGDQETAA